MMEAFAVQVPGKLLLAGEYAILEPGSLALVLAVNQYLHVECMPAQVYSLESELVTEPWLYTPEAWPQAPVPLRFAAAALQAGWQYLSASLSDLPPFALRIRSQLHQQGHKVGLGSSAAVVVGTLGALFVLCGHDIEAPQIRLQLFRLALLVHRTVQGSGSGADLAGCIHGTVTAYRSPDFERIPWQIPLDRLLAMDWPLLGIERLPWPAGWPSLVFGWTGHPADTRELLLEFGEWKKLQPDAYAEFLFESNLAALGLREALLQADCEAFVQGLGRARRLLQRLDLQLQSEARDPLPLETKGLAALADAAEYLGGAGKFSGAGGGDCGLAWVPEAHREALRQAWNLVDVQALELALDLRGIHKLSPVQGRLAFASARKGTVVKKDEVLQGLSWEDPFAAFVPEPASENWSWHFDHSFLEPLYRRLPCPQLVLEVGSWLGGSAIKAATFYATQLKWRDFTLLCVDTWLGSAEHCTPQPQLASRRFPRRFGYPVIYEQFLSNVCHAGLQEQILPLPQPSVQAAWILAQFQSQGRIPCFDWVYLDASHDTLDVLKDMELYWPLIRPGGVLMGDDWPWDSVARAVEAFAGVRGLTIESGEYTWALWKTGK